MSVRGLLLDHSAAPALIEQGLHADMVVVGSRGRGRFRTLLFGSVARAVSEHAPCPIVVVRPPSSGATARDRAIVLPRSCSSRAPLACRWQRCQPDEIVS